MGRETAKFSRFKGFKFAPWLISMWEIETKLPTFAIAITFTAYLTYILYGPQYGEIKQIEVI